jgi:hypothetical protein
MERGYIEGTQTEKLAFVITSVALWEANDIDLKKIEDISNAPLRTFGELSKNAIKVSSKEQTLHRCSCNKKVFKIFKRIQRNSNN